jgi:SOS response associated peptidase (SRAP)
LLGTARNLRPHYNIAPTTNVDVVRLDRDGRRELVSMRWGLVPFFWKKTLKDVPATFNARAETVADKPMFREAFKRRRCEGFVTDAQLGGVCPQGTVYAGQQPRSPGRGDVHRVASCWRPPDYPSGGRLHCGHVANQAHGNSAIGGSL